MHDWPGGGGQACEHRWTDQIRDCGSASCLVHRNAAIERYVDREQPLDCAGSFKAEGLGVSLFRATEGEDATSLIGLPLIRLVDMLLTLTRLESLLDVARCRSDELGPRGAAPYLPAQFDAVGRPSRQD